MDEKDKYKNSISQIKRKSYRTTEEILHDTLKAIMWFWIAFIYESNKMIVKSVNEGSKRADVTNSGLFYKPPSVAETMKYTSYMELQQHLRGLNKQSIDNINDIIRKAGDITTVSELKDMIVKELESENVYKIRYSNGAQVTPEKYAAMVARSARMETANTTHIAYAKENGTDLVQCIGPYETCEVCAQYVDRVFSISGKDKRYPSLYDTALKKGYNIIHPNCRHEFIPFFEEQHTKEENDKLREQSNRPFEDSRTMRQKNAYDLKQATNRKVWNELLSYEKAKSALGKDMPYKTLSAYRRAHRKGEDSFDYKKSHNLLKDYEQYGRWKKVLGDKEMPETLAEFQEMKYNNSKKFDELKYKKDATQAYNIALNNGVHAGKLRNFKTYTDAQLKKSINSYKKQVQEHQDKISNPNKYIDDEKYNNDMAKKGLIKKWEKDLNRNRTECMIAEEELRRRQDGR